MATKRGAALWMAAALGYLILEAVTAAAFHPTYSYPRNYISDLGLDVVSPRSYLMHAAFYLQGVLFFFGALLIVGRPENRRARVFLALTAVNLIGNIVIATVHSGAVHRVGAALAILGGNVAIAAGAPVITTVATRRWYRRTSSLAAIFGLLSLAMLIVNSSISMTDLLPDGMWERASVYSIIAWQLLTASCLLGIQRPQHR